MIIDCVMPGVYKYKISKVGREPWNNRLKSEPVNEIASLARNDSWKGAMVYFLNSLFPDLKQPLPL